MRTDFTPDNVELWISNWRRKELMDGFCDTYPHFSFIHSQIHIPYGENYIGYRVRVMGGIEAHCAPFNYEIMHRVVNINNIDKLQ